MHSLRGTHHTKFNKKSHFFLTGNFRLQRFDVQNFIAKKEYKDQWDVTATAESARVQWHWSMKQMLFPGHGEDWVWNTVKFDRLNADLNIYKTPTHWGETGIAQFKLTDAVINITEHRGFNEPYRFLAKAPLPWKWPTVYINELTGTPISNYHFCMWANFVDSNIACDGYIGDKDCTFQLRSLDDTPVLINVNNLPIGNIFQTWFTAPFNWITSGLLDFNITTREEWGAHFIPIVTLTLKELVMDPTRAILEEVPLVNRNLGKFILFAFIHFIIFGKLKISFVLM